MYPKTHRKAKIESENEESLKSLKSVSMMELHSLDRKIDHSKTHKPIGHDRYSRDRAQNNKLAKVRESENLMGAMVTISNE